MVFSSSAFIRVEATLLPTFGKQRMLTSSTASAWHASSIRSATVEDSVEVEFSGFVCIGGMYRGLLRRHLAFGRQLTLRPLRQNGRSKQRRKEAKGRFKKITNSSPNQPPTNSLDEIIYLYGTRKEALSSPEDSANIDFSSTVKNSKLTGALVFLTLRTSEMRNKVKDNALCLAAGQGWTEVVLSLLELATQPDYKDSDSRTALLNAAENGSTQVVKELMDWETFSDAKDKEHRTPLSWAARNGHEMVVEMLLTGIRTSIDSKDSDGLTPLLWAASNRHEMVVKMLLQKNANIEAKDNKG